MLGQSTLISYHTEANGYIFFAAGVLPQPYISKCYLKLVEKNHYISDFDKFVHTTESVMLKIKVIFTLSKSHQYIGNIRYGMLLYVLMRLSDV